MNEYNLDKLTEDELRILEDALGYWDIMAECDRDDLISDEDKTTEKELHLRVMRLQGIQDAEKYH